MVKPRKLISLCMIVKDEELHLPRCLTSVQGIVDEIIVVDTGSTDQTVAIAERYGARVVLAEWEHDFAKARNTGLALAQGDWILFLDADEELDTHTGKQLLAEACQPVQGLFLQIWNVTGANDDERGGTVHPVLRMFRNDDLVRFEGSIHEQIAASLLRRWPRAVFQLTDTKIIHYGYRQDIVTQKNKLQRNMELLERAVQKEPDNSFHQYNIGVEYLRAGMPSKALEAFRSARQQQGFEQLSYAHLVVKYEVRSLLSLSQWAEAADIARLGAAQFSDYPDLHHYHALALAQCGQLHAAVSSAAAALGIGAAPPQYHTEDGIGTYRTSYMLGRLKEVQLDTQGVVQAYIAALRFHPTLTPPLYRLCRYLRIAGEEARIASILAAQLACRSEEAVIKVAAIMSASGCLQAAKAWVSWHAVQLGSEAAEVLARWTKQAEHGAVKAEDEQQEEPGERYADLCERADRHLERLQLVLSPDTGMRQNVVPFVSPPAETFPVKALAMIRLLLPCEEGWRIRG
ncbi:tetratricopeptide (TPR) repeat protein [Paenibacillus endophyticus]|uniref:Tetratricopeptide (TPR) repeat protein n=1 Tax=Paenibacillus endophyticus TaxID=1294268 RepID=A0A7W5C7M6_9BACL|nr:glycosyltransferase family 2 protein [Paenibacillus endophyticus]MBB3152642.1 tetratricopeptide (TPR) repeat protein [Paenibacillus endophyticus]